MPKALRQVLNFQDTAKPMACACTSGKSHVFHTPVLQLTSKWYRVRDLGVNTEYGLTHYPPSCFVVADPHCSANGPFHNRCGKHGQKSKGRTHHLKHHHPKSLSNASKYHTEGYVGWLETDSHLTATRIVGCPTLDTYGDPEAVKAHFPLDCCTVQLCTRRVSKPLTGLQEDGTRLGDDTTVHAWSMRRLSEGCLFVRDEKATNGNTPPIFYPSSS